ncbi:type VI secretion system Vgr family protein [Paraburkholderia bannensis]|uniref:type VI secretion system Vgr family protein n=1 Tax=Paraburkholderia bannensis TaxID=765414 RepID=UPI002ABE368E|nr:type VI secretion system Vgr family protein [Paraburkholderia bannensis]
MIMQSLTSLINSVEGQQNRLLKLDTTLGSDVLLPKRVVGRSRIGRDYAFTVDVLTTTLTIELKSLIAQPVTLWIQQTDGSYCPHHGYVHTVRRLGSDGGMASFQLAFSPWLHFLKFRKDARIFQNQNVESILQSVFNGHPQARGAYRFQIRKETPVRSFCVQYEDDWNFAHRLMESEGLFGYFEQAQDGKSHSYVVTDDAHTFPPLQPLEIAFSRAGVCTEADAFVQWSGTRTLQSSTYTTRTFDYKSPFSQKSTSFPTLGNQGALPEQAEVYEYTGAYSYLESSRGDQLTKLQLEEWESRSKRFTGVCGVRHLDAGRYFQLLNHPEHDNDQIQDREFVVTETNWYIENNLPTADVDSYPHSLAQSLTAIHAKYGGSESSYVIKAADGGVGYFLVEAELQRRSVPFRSPFEHQKPHMRMQTATVVGPGGEEIYTDALNRIKAHLHWDRQNDGDENASCWLRVMFSDSGNNYGGVHVPRVGEEVVVDWLDGDCDRPLVLGRLYNGATNPHWHSNGLLSGYKSKEFGGTGYNQMVMDDSTGQNRIQLFSSSNQSHLHLGYLIQQNGNTRGSYLGSGFDLKSDAYGAVRASQGLYVTTHTASVAQPMNVDPAIQQLSNADSVLKTLSKASSESEAETLQPGHDALKSFTQAMQHDVSSKATNGQTAGGGGGSANGFAEPVVLIASPAGIGLSTESSAQLTAEQHVTLISGNNTHVAAGKSFLVSAMEKVSLFVQNAGMKLFAAKGKIEVQAHSDGMALAALKDLSIKSVSGQIVIAADKQIMLAVGGTYIALTQSGIVNGTTGQILEKCASWDVQGGDSKRIPMPTFPSTEVSDTYLHSL